MLTARISLTLSFSLVRPCHSSLPTGPQNYIICPYRAFFFVCLFIYRMLKEFIINQDLLAIIILAILIKFYFLFFFLRQLFCVFVAIFMTIKETRIIARRFCFLSTGIRSLVGCWFLRHINNCRLFYTKISIYLSSRADSADFPDSLSIRFYHPSLSAGLPNYTQCPQRADVNNFLLVSQHWQVHV